MTDVRMITKTKPVNYLVIDHNEYLLGDVVEILETLGQCDGIFNTVAIHDDTLKDSLELRGVINTNARGGSYKGSGYKAFVKEVEEVTGREIE